MAKELKPFEITLDTALEELANSTSKFDESRKYYEAETRDAAIGIATPPELRALFAQVGIPRIYINTVVERLTVEGFRRQDETVDDDQQWRIFKSNSLDSMQELLYRDMLVYGRAYISVAAPDPTDPNPLLDPELPIMRVESPRSVYAQINPRTRQVEWAIRRVQNKKNEDVSATIYTPDRTEVYEYIEGEPTLTDTITHGLGIVPIIPVINQSHIEDLYGTSLITPELRSITDAMSRILMNLQTTSELMAVPQRMIFGSSVDEITGDGTKSPLELYTASFLVFEDPSAKALSLPAAELRNYTEAMNQLVKLAAAYTGLPPQYLSTQTDNPASAEAIRYSEARLVCMCEAFAVRIGEMWELAMRVAKLVMGEELTPDDFRMETVWRNPATPTLASKADATTKLRQADIIPTEQARIDMGYTPEQRRQMQEWDKESPLAQAAALYSTSSEEVGVGSNSAGATNSRNDRAGDSI